MAENETSAKTPQLALRYIGHSEIGLVRKNNQDSAYASPTMLLVADGMGGAAAGDLASAVVVREMARIDGKHTGEEMLQALSTAVDRASDTISELVESDPSLDGMGSTASGLMFDGEQFGIVNVGDSRVYLYRDQQLTRLTHDHSFVQTLVDDGRISEEESLSHPHRSLILKVINGQPQHTPDLKLVSARAGDRLLICSDGLCGMITDPIIEQQLPGEKEAVVERLLKAVYDEGAQDNITILLADVVDGEAEGSEELFGAAANLRVDAPETTNEIPLLEEEPLAEPRPDPAAAERIRYSPTSKHRISTWLKLFLAIIIPVGLLAAGGLGWYAYTQQQYYLTAKDGRVTVFRGVPETVLSIPLSSIDTDTGIDISDLPSYYREQVTRMQYTGSKTSVDNAVTMLRNEATTCKALREQVVPAQPVATPDPTESPDPLESPETTPTPPSASPTTPEPEPPALDPCE
ncbi:MAG: protein phosphatase 2C domain-containing protein [Propionibacteriaceae bacterium]|nr:protein phosphatase 2C domain-containing protein [Propionibacteriaceae bacterium]